MKPSGVVILSVILLASFAAVDARSLYDHSKSYVTLITSLNFQKQIIKTRETTKAVLVLHFYKINDGKSPAIAKDLDEFSTEYRGLFKIGAINCAEEPGICEKEKVSSFPTIRVYPPVPLPSVDVDIPAEEVFTTQALFKTASRYLHDGSVEVNSANEGTFIKEHPAVPKVLLFTDKKGTPLIYKGLTVAFEGKQFFGIVRNTEEALVKKYGVKKFPAILLIQVSEKKPKVYVGEMKYTPIFEFLNVYSQAFVPGGSLESSASKPWLSEIVPEMHIKSGRDVCLGQEGVLCVILFHAGKPDNGIVDTLKKLNTLYERSMERGLQYKFMWIDTQQEPKWAQHFNFQQTPKIVLLNSGKRKRFIEHEGDIFFESLKKTLEKISGGDARFKRIADADVPEFSAVRKDV